MVIERRGDALAIILPPRTELGWFALFLFMLGGWALPLLFLAQWLRGVVHPENDPVGLIPIAVLAVGGTLVPFFYAGEGSRQTTLLVGSDRLEAIYRQFGWTRRWAWPRQEIATIRTGRGVMIVGKRSSARFMTGRPRREIRWLAELLCQRLGIDNTLPARPDEIAVEWAITDWKLAIQELEITTRFSAVEPESYRGYLGVQPGVMCLRYHAGETPDYRLYDARQAGLLPWCRLLARAGVCLLSPDDVMCEARAEAGARLRIESPWPRITFTIWCADGAALHAALARFWGAEEEAP
jgi:hypothetical protein